MQIIWAGSEDAPALAQVFFDAVRLGPSPYTSEQRIAWMPKVPEGEVFAARLAPLKVSAAIVQGKHIGFMTLDDMGYIDLAFILHEHRGKGVFRKLYTPLEAEALRCRMPRLRTHASLMARPAFQAAGFSVIQFETVTRAGEDLCRAEMEKRLP